MSRRRSLSNPLSPSASSISDPALQDDDQGGQCAAFFMPGVGEKQLTKVANGYYFTGPTSNIKMSYVFLIAAVHIVHVVAGIISLLVVIANHLRNKYSSEEMLGLELGATFWHFLDILWIYLILFMYFVN